MDRRNGQRPRMKAPDIDYKDKELVGCMGYAAAFIFFAVSIGVVIWLT
ncbi:MAG: hypothetical protein HOO86_09940 [Bacteroidales bacterium]|nr:hypothetical protein [Bacteroidales bacterium]